MSNYDDIIHMERPQYEDLPPMSIHDRAAQFSPFAALVGYDDAVAETARLTERRREMSEEEVQDLNEKINILTERSDSRPLVQVMYFIADPRKSGGRYAERKGRIRTIDAYHRRLVFTDGTTIPIEDTYAIRIQEEEQ
ncbi:MAG: hypothetical protein J5379_08160 [Clostridiales bacterium]|nr:hypothetical protein [Clostridiales bacterium]